ncbi:MAG: extracellular solute-binding protein [Cellulosilyticaceae bacterium]
MKKFKTLCLISAVLGVSLLGSGCGSKGNDQVVIYSNADEEAVAIMEKALNRAGYEGQYILQSMGTSEIGGKMMVEGSSIEADILTMSTYYIESAQKENQMFADLNFALPTLNDNGSYYAPLLGNVGSLFINTEVIKENGLQVPTSFKDLTRPEYANLISIPNIMDSSTAWLGIQAIIDYYGEDEGRTVLHELIKNCGPHIESSGSAPLKKVRAGEVAAGFGLRHQAVADAKEGKPIQYIDPIEGNFTLTEGIAVVKKQDDKKMALAMDMAKAIVQKGREELIMYYPVALYEGETVDEANQATYAKSFKEPLTVELLKKHQEFFTSAK